RRRIAPGTSTENTHTHTTPSHISPHLSSSTISGLNTIYEQQLKRHKAAIRRTKFVPSCDIFAIRADRAREPRTLFRQHSTRHTNRLPCTPPPGADAISMRKTPPGTRLFLCAGKYVPGDISTVGGRS
ncbi:unnamed protein product, partial [Ectocarpus fasciculatus]